MVADQAPQIACDFPSHLRLDQQLAEESRVVQLCLLPDAPEFLVDGPMLVIERGSSTSSKKRTK
jgi:hypothetical protein